MQVFDHLKISSPAAKCQVSGADEEMALAVAGEDRNLGMKDARRSRDRLDIIVLADPARPLLAQSRPDALDIRKNESLTPATTYERIEDNSFKE